MGIAPDIPLDFSFSPTNNNTLKPLASKPFILFLINVSEYPGSAGNTRPIFNFFDIKRPNHAGVLTQLVNDKYHCICTDRCIL